METMRKRCMKVLVYSWSILLVLNFFVYPLSADEGEITITVIPSISVVSGSETFSISIYCEPGQPMKSFEFSISFNETLLHASSVTEGDMFDGYETFFNSGTINNNNGMITSVFDLIVGTGNVTSSGYLVNISFTAQGVSGTCPIQLVNAGVTNEEEYLPLSVTNSSVQIDASAPSVVDNSLGSGTTGDSFTFNVSVSDDQDDSADIITKVDWSHGLDGENESMIFSGGSYFEKTITLDDSVSDMVYTIYVEDTYGNSLTTSSSSVSVSDNDDPQIVSDTSSGTGTTGDSYSWCINTSDNIDDEDELIVKINWAHGSFAENATMSYSGSYWSYSHALDDTINDMTYSIFVEDSAGNTIYTTGSHSPVSVSDNDDPVLNTVQASPSVQSKDGTVNLSCEITDNIEVSVVKVNVEYPDSSTINISVIDNQLIDTFYYMTSYSLLGSYSFFFYAEDSSGNTLVSSTETFIISDDSSPVISNMSYVSSNPVDTDASFGWINISCTVIDDELNLICLEYTVDETTTNVSMVSAGNNMYYYNTTFTSYGNYTYFVWANDTSGNTDISSVCSYSLPPNWDVNEDGIISVIDFTSISNHFDETGSLGWIREDVDNDGEINVLDIVISSNHYFEEWW